ncbi:MAG: TatD family hydrolase [Erysipelotrichaceae bacterium]
MYIDTHSHLTCLDCLNEVEETIVKCQKNDVNKILVICCSKEDLENAYIYQNKYPKMLDIAFGYHPEVIGENSKYDLAYLEEQLIANKLVAIGEIGLDFYYDQDHKLEQEQLFKDQIALAKKYNLPVLVHTRDASEMTYQILKEENLPRKGILHCYSGSVEMMERYLKIGYYISLAGVVTFKNAKVAKEVAKQIPIDRLFYETDSPYLTPEPFRGKKNDSSKVIYTANYISDLRNISVEELNSSVQNNYERLFNEKI